MKEVFTTKEPEFTSANEKKEHESTSTNKNCQNELTVERLNIVLFSENVVQVHLTGLKSTLTHENCPTSFHLRRQISEPYNKMLYSFTKKA